MSTCPCCNLQLAALATDIAEDGDVEWHWDGEWGMGYGVWGMGMGIGIYRVDIGCPASVAMRVSREKFQLF